VTLDIVRLRAVDLTAVRVLLCDADGCLFPSEEPAFEASAAVTNDLLSDLGIDKRFSPDELRAVAVGKNFRATAVDLAAAHGATLDPAELDRRVELERREVSAHLARVLEPDPSVRDPLTELGWRFGLAVVSSSALARLDACFEATGLAGLFPPNARFSAEDSLPVPTSKPDPAVYTFAGQSLGVDAGHALAIEDSATGARSAVAAGFPTIGNVLFVAEEEREERIAALGDAGVAAVISSWGQLVEMIDAGTTAYAAAS
jgi:beta-phosphoglucomutase-like phosphatase (HAD superfamily)